MRTRLTAPIAIALALLITPALSGCFANPLESIIEGATGGDVDLGGTSVPEGYPTSEVPLIDGDIVFGGAIGDASGRIFNVTVRVSGPEAIEQIKTQLEGAGLTSQADLGDTTAGGTYIASSADWGVLVVVSEDSANGWIASYTVTTASAQ